MLAASIVVVALAVVLELVFEAVVRVVNRRSPAAPPTAA